MSAAIAAYYAQGLSLPDSIEKAKNYINRNLQKILQYWIWKWAPALQAL